MPAPRNARSVLVRRVRRRAGKVARRFGLFPTIDRIDRGATARNGAVRHGMVEEFSTRRVSGWVSTSKGAARVRVTLRVNDLDVTHTQAAAPSARTDDHGEVRQFRFVLSHLWRYVGPDDRISVRVAADALPIAGHGMAVTPTERGTKSVADLRASLDGGYVFSRFGALQKSRKLDVAWQRRMTTAADSIRAAVDRRFGYDVFYAYGSMLGAVRDRGFLGHDDDLDLGYLSRHRDGALVGAELRDIGLALIEEGWRVEPFEPLLHLYGEVEGVQLRIDLFPHYFDADGVLRIPWGTAGTARTRIAQWQGVHDVPFGSGTAPIPVAAESVLAQLYGDEWREPQPGFSWELDRTEQATEAMLSRQQWYELYWSDFYARTGFDEPSPFALDVLARPDCPDLVVDIGCGDGRDSVAFARGSRQVLAVDSNARAIARAVTRRDADGLSESMRIERVDVMDQAAFGALLAQLPTDRPRLFYLRFLLHGYPAGAETPLLAAIRRAARPGDLLAAEFRSLADRARPKVHRMDAREFRDGDALAARLRDEFGWSVLAGDHATGRSPYGKEDPDLYRIVARRDE